MIYFINMNDTIYSNHIGQGLLLLTTPFQVTRVSGFDKYWVKLQ
jgi:hypothetical protein